MSAPEMDNVQRRRVITRVPQRAVMDQSKFSVGTMHRQQRRLAGPPFALRPALGKVLLQIAA